MHNILDFVARYTNCKLDTSKLVHNADFWCNRRCETNPVDLEGFGVQVWPSADQATPPGPPGLQTPPQSPVSLVQAVAASRALKLSQDVAARPPSQLP